MLSPRESTLLHAVGARVRARRRDRGLTLAELAERSDLSSRFLADVEAGRANISVVKLHRLARALGESTAALVEEPRGETVALLGLRGAGKSTVGAALAQRLGFPFLELDVLVEEQAGLPLSEIFAVHGEALYRRLEAQVLDGVLGSAAPAVVATGGGLVTARETYDRLKRGCVTVWLRARPEEHMDRVRAQGDLRPMAARSDAMAELRQLLEERTPLYAEADVVVDTSGRSVAGVLDALAGALAERGHAA